jgi:hypothetical protein
MYSGKLRKLTILAAPLVLALSLVIGGVALADATLPGAGFPAAGNGNGPGAVTGAPTISGVSVSDITATSARISWTTNEPAGSLVRYGTSADSLNFSAANAAADTAHQVVLANLNPATQYFFLVESQFADGALVDDNGGDLYRFTTLEAQRPSRAFTGELVGDPNGTVTLVLEGTGEEVSIILPRDYLLNTPGGPRAGVFQAGAGVVVLALQSGADWVAQSVLIKPVQPNVPLVGVVARLGSGSLTILDTHGRAHLLQANGLVENLQEGEVVTVFADQANRARGLVRAEEVRNRISLHLDEIADNQGEVVTEAEQRDLVVRAGGLIQGLEAHGEQQLRVLNAALQHAPQEVRDKVNAAQARAQAGIENARGAAGRAQKRLDRLESRDGQGGGGGPPDGSDSPGPPDQGQGRGGGPPDGSDSPGPPGQGQGRGGGPPQGGDSPGPPGQGQGRGRP